MFWGRMVTAVDAQTTSGSIITGVEGHYGFCICHRPSVQPKKDSHLGAFVVTVSSKLMATNNGIHYIIIPR
ncbi:MAG: hypothetical protein R2847_09245 [Bacteroidia bacterium]